MLTRNQDPSLTLASPELQTAGLILSMSISKKRKPDVGKEGSEWKQCRKNDEESSQTPETEQLSPEETTRAHGTAVKDLKFKLQCKELYSKDLVDSLHVHKQMLAKLQERVAKTTQEWDTCLALLGHISNKNKESDKKLKKELEQLQQLNKKNEDLNDKLKEKDKEKEKEHRKGGHKQEDEGKLKLELLMEKARKQKLRNKITERNQKIQDVLDEWGSESE
jgi:hypothetical protein